MVHAVGIDVQGQRHRFGVYDEGMGDIHSVRVDFEETLSVRSLNLSVESLDEREPVHVHLWDVEFE